MELYNYLVILFSFFIINKSVNSIHTPEGGGVKVPIRVNLNRNFHARSQQYVDAPEQQPIMHHQYSQVKMYSTVNQGSPNNQHFTRSDYKGSASSPTQNLILPPNRENEKNNREDRQLGGSSNSENELFEYGTECPPQGTGQFPYLMDCRQFLNCFKGRGYIQSCAPGTLFNPETRECDYPSKVICASLSNPQGRQQPASGNQFSANYQSPPAVVVNTLQFQTHHKKSIECEPDASGLYEHPYDCTKFLNCGSGRTFVQDCGPGTVFNKYFKVCDWPHNVDCGGKITIQPEVDEVVEESRGNLRVAATTTTTTTTTTTQRPQYPRPPTWNGQHTSSFHHNHLHNQQGPHHNHYQPGRYNPYGTLNQPTTSTITPPTPQQVDIVSHHNQPVWTNSNPPWMKPNQFDQNEYREDNDLEIVGQKFDQNTDETAYQPTVHQNTNYGWNSQQQPQPTWNQSPPPPSTHNHWTPTEQRPTWSQNQPPRQQPVPTTTSTTPAPSHVLPLYNRQRQNRTQTNQQYYLNNKPSDQHQLANLGMNDSIPLSDAIKALLRPYMARTDTVNEHQIQNFTKNLETKTKLTGEQPFLIEGGVTFDDDSLEVDSSVEMTTQWTESQELPSNTNPNPEFPNVPRFQPPVQNSPDFNSPEEMDHDHEPEDCPFFKNHKHNHNFHNHNHNFNPNTKTTVHWRFYGKEPYNPDSDENLSNPNHFNFQHNHHHPFYHHHHHHHNHDHPFHHPTQSYPTGHLPFNVSLTVPPVMHNHNFHRHHNHHHPGHNHDGPFHHPTVPRYPASTTTYKPYTPRIMITTTTARPVTTSPTPHFPVYSPPIVRVLPPRPTTTIPTTTSRPLRPRPNIPPPTTTELPNFPPNLIPPKTTPLNNFPPNFIPPTTTPLSTLPPPYIYNPATNTYIPAPVLQSPPTTTPSSPVYPVYIPKTTITTTTPKTPTRLDDDDDDGNKPKLTFNKPELPSTGVLPSYPSTTPALNECNPTNVFECGNGQCVSGDRICDGKNDCGNREDEKNCDQVIGYEIRLSSDSDNKHEGRVEVKVFGVWGYICDDKFGMRDADVLCRELGFPLGASEVRGNSFYSPNINVTQNGTPVFLMDELDCKGNESSLKDCDFDGWGIHDCNTEEVVGVVCKIPVMTCPLNYWLCEKSEECIPTSFICDGVADCADSSDEKASHCNAPFDIRLVGGIPNLEGRLEVRYRGIWGTVCDDDFRNVEASVVCRMLGHGGPASSVKSAFGPGVGQIWLDQVNCIGNETSIADCSHWHWGEHNCAHSEDVGIRCTVGPVQPYAPPRTATKTGRSRQDDPDITYEGLQRSSKILPDQCGQIKVPETSLRDQSYHFRVIKGTEATKGYHPWQSTIRVKGQGKSSHWCGAVLISRYHLLTAAHCLIGFPKGAYIIRMGDHNSEVFEQSEVEIFIENTYIHEDFRKGHHMNNDIAVIVLKSPVRFTDYIQPVCLPSKNIAYQAGMNCTISGWGSIQSGKSTPSIPLRSGNVPILSNELCKQPQVYGDVITDGMFCAGSLDEGIDACDGDSGGPLVCVNNGVHTLYGIISWGQHCGYANRPGVYTKVSYYTDWIQDRLNQSMTTYGV